MTDPARLSLSEHVANAARGASALPLILAFIERVGVPTAIAGFVLYRIDAHLEALTLAVNALASHLMLLRPP